MCFLTLHTSELTVALLQTGDAEKMPSFVMMSRGAHNLAE